MLKNLLSILGKQNLYSSILISIFIIIATILESLSIGLIFPILNSFLDQTISSKSLFLENLFLYLNVFNISNKGVFFIVFFFIVYFLKILFLVFFLWYKNQFIWRLHNNLVLEIYKKYLEQNLNFFKSNNISIIYRNIISEISILIGSGISPLINLISNLFIVLGIATILLIIDFKMTSILIILTTFISYIFIIVNNIFLKKWSLKRQTNDASRIKILNQSINSIKETKLYNKEKWFFDKFIYHNNVTFNALKNYDFVKTLPRYFIELTIVSILCFIFILKGNLLNSNLSISYLVVIVAAVLRLVPIVSQILSNFQSLSYSKASYYIISDLYKLEPKNKFLKIQLNPTKFLNKIEIKNLSIGFQRNGESILNKIDFKISKGEFVGITGGSGSGKTTLLDLLMGLEKPNEGDILVDGRSIFENTKNWQAIIGYIPQNIYLPYDYLYENIAFGIDKQNIKQEALTNSIKVAELDNLITNEHNNNEVYIGDQGSILSGGEKQRVAIARAIYLNPEVLIFDEPTSSLDTKTEENIIKTINKIKLNKTIIMVSHNKSALKYCDKIYKIENKKINLISK